MRLNMVSERKIGTLFHKEHKPTNRVCLIKQTVLEVSSRQCETLRRFVDSSTGYSHPGLRWAWATSGGKTDKNSSVG